METEPAIKWTRIDKIPPHPDNAKAHDLEQLVESFRLYGFRGAVTITDGSGLTSEGHGRVQALLQMLAAGEPAPAGVRVAKNGAWSVLVLHGLPPFETPEHERAFLIASNKVGEGLWDAPKLAAQLQQLAKATAPPLTGYTGPDLTQLLRQLNKGTKRKPTDDVPAVPKKPRTKRGDLWALGDHLLLCGDSKDGKDVQRLLDGEADVILTDPPYCSGGFQEAGRATGSIGNRDNRKLKNDQLSTRGYKSLITGVLKTWDAASAYIFTDWRMWVTLFDLVENAGMGARSMIVWDKGHAGMGQGWRSQHELILFATRATVKFLPANSRGNVVQAKRAPNDLHPTQKPVDLLAEILRVHPVPRHVSDPFVGSGSTLLACHQENVPFRGMELEPGFCDVTIQRWEEHTGGKAKRKGARGG